MPGIGRLMLLNIQSAADELDVTMLEIAAAIDRGELLHVKVGGQIRIPMNAIDRYRNRERE